MCFSFALYVADFDELNPVHGFGKVSQKLKNTEKSDYLKSRTIVQVHLYIGNHIKLPKQHYQ